MDVYFVFFPLVLPRPPAPLGWVRPQLLCPGRVSIIVLVHMAMLCNLFLGLSPLFGGGTLVQGPHYILAPLGSVKLLSTEAFHESSPEE